MKALSDADASVLACGALPGAKAAVSSLAASEKDSVVKDAVAPGDADAVTNALEFPAIVEHGDRRIRRWALSLCRLGPIEQELEQLGVVCQTSIELLRLSAHFGLARPLSSTAVDSSSDH